MPEATPETKVSFWSRIGEKKNDIAALAGLLASFGSWGYTVLNPQPQIGFGLFLMVVAFVCAAVIVIHLFSFKWKGAVATFVIVFLCFWFYAKKIVISPAAKREIVEQLQKGYGVREECSIRGAYDHTPPWMRDSQEAWKATGTSLLEHAGHIDDLQMWSDSRLIGLATESDFNAFRCTDVNLKVMALETIIARHYDSTIKPNPYHGPTYVLNPATGGIIKDGTR